MFDSIINWCKEHPIWAIMIAIVIIALVYWAVTAAIHASRVSAVENTTAEVISMQEEVASVWPTSDPNNPVATAVIDGIAVARDNWKNANAEVKPSRLATLKNKLSAAKASFNDMVGNTAADGPYAIFADDFSAYADDAISAIEKLS